MIVYQYNYFVFCTEMNDVSKVCFWALMIAISVSVAICQFAHFLYFRKKSIVIFYARHLLSELFNNCVIVHDSQHCLLLQFHDRPPLPSIFGGIGPQE